MEGWTTFPMRVWLHMASHAREMTTPFLRITSLEPKDQLPWGFAPELAALRGIFPYRVTPQFITGDPQHFLRAADLLPPLISPVIELNCGCPSPNSLGTRAGSGMLSDPEQWQRSLSTLSDHLGPRRLSIKMRLGIANDDEFSKLFEAIADLPLARLTIHGRTRTDGYRGHARWAPVEEAAQRALYPVYASGDIWGLESWQQFIKVAPHASGAMIGRGLLRNPWIFTELEQGRPVRLSMRTLQLALYAYMLMQELWIHQPEKLVVRMAQGRISSPAGTVALAWEKLCAELSALTWGIPLILARESELQSRKLSPTAFSRLKLLWSYLRSSLPPECDLPQLMKAKTPASFFEALHSLAEVFGQNELELKHRRDWDAHFARARG